MLNTKLPGNRPSGSGEEDFLSSFPYMGMAVYMVMWPGPNVYTFFCSLPEGCIWNLIEIGSVVIKTKSSEDVDRRMTDKGGYNPWAKYTFSTFSIQKPMGPNLTLPSNRSNSVRGHHLYKS